MLSTFFTRHTPEPPEGSIILFTNPAASGDAYAWRRYENRWHPVTQHETVGMTWDQVQDALMGVEVWIFGPENAPESITPLTIDK